MLPLVWVLGAGAGGPGSSFRRLSERGPRGRWCSLTGFGGPRRRLAVLEDAPISPRLSAGRGGNGVGLHASLQPPQTPVSGAIFPATACPEAKTQTLGIGSFCPLCPEKTRLPSAWTLPCCWSTRSPPFRWPQAGPWREHRGGGEQLPAAGGGTSRPGPSTAVLLPRTERWGRGAGLPPDGAVMGPLLGDWRVQPLTQLTLRPAAPGRPARVRLPRPRGAPAPQESPAPCRRDFMCRTC